MRCFGPNFCGLAAAAAAGPAQAPPTITRTNARQRVNEDHRGLSRRARVDARSEFVSSRVPLITDHNELGRSEFRTEVVALRRRQRSGAASRPRRCQAERVRSRLRAQETAGQIPQAAKRMVNYVATGRGSANSYRAKGSPSRAYPYSRTRFRGRPSAGSTRAPAPSLVRVDAAKGRPGGGASGPESRRPEFLRDALVAERRDQETTPRIGMCLCKVPSAVPARRPRSAPTMARACRGRCLWRHSDRFDPRPPNDQGIRRPQHVTHGGWSQKLGFTAPERWLYGRDCDACAD